MRKEKRRNEKRTQYLRWSIRWLAKRASGSAVCPKESSGVRAADKEEEESKCGRKGTKMEREENG